MPATQKNPKSWSGADTFTVVLETAGLYSIEMSAYCGERGLCAEHVKTWRQESQDAYEARF